MKMFMFVLVSLFVVSGVNAATIDDIETLTGGTYLDFDFTGAYTRAGLTATTTGSGWGYPDSSIGASGGDGVNATGMDSSGSGGDAEFQVDVTGLVSGDYLVYVVGLGSNIATLPGRSRPWRS